jgi:hypothetical protein
MRNAYKILASIKRTNRLGAHSRKWKGIIKIDLTGRSLDSAGPE